MDELTRFQAPRVWLAPMSGATDAAFRQQALRFGAPAVVSEMVAGEQLLAERSDVVRRTNRHEGVGLWIVQLAGRRPSDMLHGARRLSQDGVDVIDINMGCPSRQVTGGQSGSALMREPDLAKAIIDATIEGAGSTPVTLKMRLGWDHQSLNAPVIASYAVSAGIQVITVHGRTRCQFYKGTADWIRVRDTVDAVDVPVIVNGDIFDLPSAQSAMAASGADGVMIGRAAMGRPWLIAEIAAGLEGRAFSPPDIAQQCDSLCEQIEESASLYGEGLGVRTARKHVSAAIDHVNLPLDTEVRRAIRADLCRIDDAAGLIAALRTVYSGRVWKAAA